MGRSPVLCAMRHSTAVVESGGILRAKLLNGNNATLRAALIRESRGSRVFSPRAVR